MSRFHFHEVAADLRLHFDATTEKMRGDIRLVAESVVHVAERLDRTDAKIDRSAAETHAMIRFFARGARPQGQQPRRVRV